VRRLHARLLPEHKMVSQPAFRAQPANHLEAFSCTSGSAACSYEGLILRPVSIRGSAMHQRLLSLVESRSDLPAL
jgi:hypothetical protein